MTYRSVILIFAGLLSSGCHSNLYATPRTTPAGKTQHIVAIDLDKIPKTANFIPPAIVYIVRHGLSERIDFGVQVSSTLKADLKINAVRTNVFDLAIDPAISTGIFAIGTVGGGFFTAAVPVILGLNFGEYMTLVTQVGPAYTNGFGWPVYPFFGGGLQIRPSELLTIQPELTMQFVGNEPMVCYGIGFGFGPHASYAFKNANAR